MIHYRETIIKEIIYSSGSVSIESIIDKHIQLLIENGTHIILVFRIFDKLKISLSEISGGALNDSERSNVIQALTILKNYDMQKLTEKKTQKK